MTFINKVAFIVFVFTFYSLGCARRIDPKDFSGGYESFNTTSYSNLVLSNDASFTYEVSTRSGNWQSVRGTWQFEVTGSQKDLWLKPFVFDGGRRVDAMGLTAERTRDGLFIYTDPEKRQGFVKVSRQ